MRIYLNIFKEIWKKMPVPQGESVSNRLTVACEYFNNLWFGCSYCNRMLMQMKHLVRFDLWTGCYVFDKEGIAESTETWVDGCIQYRCRGQCQQRLDFRVDHDAEVHILPSSIFLYHADLIF